MQNSVSYTGKGDMADVIHIINGDSAGETLACSGVEGEILIWRDVLYDGIRQSGWPDEEGVKRRAAFLSAITGGAHPQQQVVVDLSRQYERLRTIAPKHKVVLWFDACLFDQSMLVHILSCLEHCGVKSVYLLCIDAFPGIDPFHGLGQLSPEQLASLYGKERPVTPKQFELAITADNAFARQDIMGIRALAERDESPLLFLPAAARRWLDELPHPETGLGLLEQLVVDAVHEGWSTPWEIFTAVAKADRPPQYWGDITLWAKINTLAGRTPPPIRIAGPEKNLPLWPKPGELKNYRVERAE